VAAGRPLVNMLYRSRETLRGIILLGLHAIINVATQNTNVIAEGAYEKK
jgi:hypothetical protein